MVHGGNHYFANRGTYVPANFILLQQTVPCSRCVYPQQLHSSLSGDLSLPPFAFPTGSCKDVKFKELPCITRCLATIEEPSFIFFRVYQCGIIKVHYIRYVFKIHIRDYKTETPLFKTINTEAPQEGFCRPQGVFILYPRVDI
jgi:hypothetical protein